MWIVFCLLLQTPAERVKYTEEGHKENSSPPT